jgi:hypothetical protein
MEINSQWTTEIKTGDLIVIAASGSWLEYGFFLGRGQGHSVQFYSMHRLHNWMIDRSNGKKRTLCKNFYNNHYLTKIARCTSEFFSPEMMIVYEGAINALKFLKIIQE